MKGFPAIRCYKAVQPAPDGPAGFLHIFRSKHDERDEDDKEKFGGSDPENFHERVLYLVQCLLEFVLMIRETAQHTVDEARGRVGPE